MLEGTEQRSERLNVETTTTNNVFRSAWGRDGVGWEDADGSVTSDG